MQHLVAGAFELADLCVELCEYVLAGAEVLADILLAGLQVLFE